LTIGDGLGMSFFKNFGEKYSIPIDKVIELKNELLRLNIFQIEKDYPSISMDGTRWGLSVRFDGKKISSKGHNNYPAMWKQIINAIEDCIKYKYKSSKNMQEVKMTEKIDKINEAVWKAINKTINKFREHPYYFFTESDIHSYFYYALYSTHHEESTDDKERIYCVHREYPTNFRYKKSELLNEGFKKPYDLSWQEGDRGHYDIAILNPKFIKNANSKEDIVNKSVKLLKIRIKDNKDFKELLFAIEFKYVINNSKKFVDEVKMDNKKLFFAKKYGSSIEAVNLVFCNVDFKYKSDLINVIKNANDKILSIFIQSYNNKGGGRALRSIKMNKEDSEIKYGESPKILTK